MSAGDDLRTRGTIGNVPGYAMAHAHVLEDHQAAWARVDNIDRSKAIEKVTRMHNAVEYTLDYQTCAGLSPLEKVVLANGGPAPWGGSAPGIKVTVFID